ncbi:MAG: DNA-directed RNA polymerase subunit D [Candidatus Micrarchaeota archaeon]
MKITNVKSEGDKLEFKLSGCTVGLANALRRISMSQVPVFAIERITVYENTSSLFDEYLANRLALIPLKTPERIGKEEEVMFSLDAEGPTIVYSEELKGTDSKIKVAVKGIPIISLEEGQKLRLEAKARMGIAREHAKFQPGLVAYSFDPKENSFLFKVESFGQMSAADMLSKALQVLEAKFDELEIKLKESGDEK